MTTYTSITDADRTEMLSAVGLSSIDELFADVPSSLRLPDPLDLPRGCSEREVFDELRRMAERNVSCDDEISFLGGGMYDHYVPALVDAITSRSEFLTPYTPYQPEVSQGGLQVMFEYQTAISELTGLPVSNASVYDGPSAVAAAGYMSRLHTGRGRLVCSRALHPHSRETLQTSAEGWKAELSEVPLRNAVTDPEALAERVDENTSAVFVQQPNFLGAVEDIESLAAVAHERGALLVCSCDPIALGVLRSPGECGADVAVGEGQPLGNRLDFGGPSFGFFAAREEFLRRMPGRIAGETTDLNGDRGFVLTLQTREQHIRRERATSNICTAQALNALAGIVYLSWLGKRGLVELCHLLAERTHRLRLALAGIPGISPIHDQPVVREFAVELGAPVEQVVEHCVAEGVNPGHPLGTEYPEYPNGLLVALTEQRTPEHINRLIDVLGRAVAASKASNPGPSSSKESS
ncbi:MAG: aminomethyl-transferring glycine dehydrogenase subunit GcvPA [Solirubrobacterales bacterium]|nr:aminomethyl-transferring glycine dehydrogenase subunit GcvPA [Solirubrobacterales bacterium]